ncbi:MAG: DUF6485 family protein [Candidatus Edwardsbacteria bacterium]|nr:DUF6485 family protein [Candidatus Edwardsbacteria bacterium]
MDCRKESNKTSCTCTYEPCPRKGVCCECVAYHRKNGEVPGCFFSQAGEASYDRSVRSFIKDQSR